MTRRRVAYAVFALIAALISCGAAQAAGLFRAYVTSDGNDANPCTLPQPCRLLPAALTAVADGGDIWMLDSANYNTGPVNVGKSVTILAVPGAVGSVVALAGDAIDVATAGVKLTLRNLVIVPFPAAGAVSGVNMTSGAALTLENCLVAGLPQSGIVVNAAASVRITDSVIRKSGAPGLGLRGGARATLTGASISANVLNGIYVYGHAAGSVTT